MIPYKNLDGNSGVVEYEVGPTFIKVRFQHNAKIYVYDYASPGRPHVEQMKKLADAGKGLSGYISRNVKDQYVRIEH